MANIMQMFRAKNKVTRDSYDLSKKLAFTAQAGELLPVYSRYLMPGDVFDIESKWKTRTAPINTAAFTRFREYYDWYFVPINLLWDKFHTWTTNMKDNNQVATSIKGTNNLTDKHPYFTTNQIRTYLNGMKANATPNQFQLPRYVLQQKILHLLGYGDFYDLDAAPLYNLEMAPWRALAYQKIYQDWYRNSQWEAAAPQTCNINYISGTSSDLQIPLGDYQVSDDSMFDLRYANWNKDLFMGLLPNSQYGDAASINLSGNLSGLIGGNTSQAQFSLYSQAASDNVPVVTVSGSFASVPDANSQLRVNDSGSSATNSFYLSPTGVQNIRSAMNLSASGSINSAFTILALRQAEALQKWKEITESNSKDFPSQIDAHFGVRPSTAYSQRCQRIGGYDGTIEIQDVDNTNITENEDGSFNGADIAGKGLSFGQGKSKTFKTDVPGILMCIYHVVPLLDYALGSVAMENMKTLFTDYAIPEFDRTGMMQVPLAAFSNKKLDFVPSSASVNLGSGLLGYAPNYIDYKTDIDEVKGGFYSDDRLRTWVAPITDSYIKQWISNQNQTNTNFTFRGLTYNFFKVNPSVTNPIFAQASTADVGTDKFWVNCYFQIHAIRPLDAQGLPY